MTLFYDFVDAIGQIEASENVRREAIRLEVAEALFGNSAQQIVITDCILKKVFIWSMGRQVAIPI